MATIRKRGDYQWQVMVRRSGFPQISETFNTKAEAELWGREKEKEMDEERFVDNRVLHKSKLSSLIDLYEEEITPTKKGSDQELYKLKNLRKHPIADMLLSKIGPADIVEYRNARMKEVGPATVNKEMNLLSSIFRIAASEWKLRGLANPVTGVRRPKMPRGRERRLDASGEEMRRILEATESVALRVLFPLAIETAMRRSEMVGLKLADVNFAAAKLKLHDTKNGESREVPLSTRAIAALKTLEKRKDGLMFGIKPHSASVAFRRSLHRAREKYVLECEEIGVVPDPKFLTDLRLHDLRHEATSRLFELGCFDAVMVSAITGHKDMRQLKKYTHPRAEDLAKKLG